MLHQNGARTRLVVLLALATAAACARPAQEESADPAMDSARHQLTGKVAVVGSDPFPQIVLRPDTGGSEIRIEAADPGPIGRVAGARVTAFGELDPDARRLRLERFAVLSMDGIPAVDGVLEREGDGLVLVTGESDRLRIAFPPAALYDHVGSRVWLSGSEIEREPEAFGLIDPEPL